MSKGKFLISTIIPVYNVENYLAETLDCIINQSIGFEKNVEMIIINDGSPDNSEEIVLEYQKKYPKNIVYIKQKNAGVSAARNRGIDIATGEFIHFMDSDDVVNRGFYKEIIGFFKRHGDEVDFVTSKIKHFDASWHPGYLNAKFRQAPMVIDTDRDVAKPIYHIVTGLIRKSAIDNLRFDKSLPITEDAKLLIQIVHKKRKYGIVKRATYYYRRRQGEDSAINTKFRKKEYFTKVPMGAYGDMMRLWVDSSGKPSRFIQHEVLNDLQWKFREENDSIDTPLSDSEKEQYKRYIYKLASDIEDKVILDNPFINIEHKTFLLKKNHGRKAYEDSLSFSGGTYYFNDEELMNVWRKSRSDSGIFIEFINHIEGNRYRIEGRLVFSDISDRDSRYIRTSMGDFEMRFIERREVSDNFLGDRFAGKKGFVVDIEVDDNDSIQSVLKVFSGDEILTEIYSGRFAGVGMLKNSYKKIGNITLRRVSANKLDSSVPSRMGRIWMELRFMFKILVNLRVRDAITWMKEAKNSLSFKMPMRYAVIQLIKPPLLVVRSLMVNIKDILIRLIYFLGLYRSNKPIWIISDRGTMAGDNGEALFEYIIKNKKPEAEVYYAISRGSSDFERLRKTGPVLNFGSLKYILMHLRSAKIISSSADDFVQAPIPRYSWHHFSDLLDHQFVFLQHGITKDDMSEWLNRFSQNISLFVTAAKAEYESILKGDYYYSKNEVVLTGFPRFDKLVSNPRNKLILAPTWRADILPEARGNRGGVRQYSGKFKNTDYFNFYNGLMKDGRLASALRAANMTGELYIHPAFSSQVDDFESSDIFKVKSPPYDYSRAFEGGSLLVTDYSSVAFDFAYLNKPVIYTQFDKDSLYKTHIYSKGYFSYEENGFGPVTYDLGSSVDEIVKHIKANCIQPDKYKKRVSSFFEFVDSKNSERVYQAIISMDK